MPRKKKETTSESKAPKEVKTSDETVAILRTAREEIESSLSTPALESSIDDLKEEFTAMLQTLDEIKKLSESERLQQSERMENLSDLFGECMKRLAQFQSGLESATYVLTSTTDSIEETRYDSPVRLYYQFAMTILDLCENKIMMDVDPRIHMNEVQLDVDNCRFNMVHQAAKRDLCNRKRQNWTRAPRRRSRYW